MNARVRRKFLRTLFIKCEPLHVMNISLLLFEVARSCSRYNSKSRRVARRRCVAQSRCIAGRRGVARRAGSRRIGRRICWCSRCILVDINHDSDRLSEEFTGVVV